MRKSGLFPIVEKLTDRAGATFVRRYFDYEDLVEHAMEVNIYEYRCLTYFAADGQQFDIFKSATDGAISIALRADNPMPLFPIKHISYDTRFGHWRIRMIEHYRDMDELLATVKVVDFRGQPKEVFLDALDRKLIVVYNPSKGNNTSVFELC